jgi:uncharacterized protein (DUF2147 family)
VARTASAVGVGLCLLALIGASRASHPGDTTPEGPWNAFDDHTGERRAVVRVSLRDGQLAGAIERLIVRPGEEENPLCDRCKGSLHNKPVLGMEILRGHSRKGERWVGGRVLDPQNGKEYRSTVWLEEPDRLCVRGYWGPFYRTQTWLRAKEEYERSSDVDKRAPEGSQ